MPDGRVVVAAQQTANFESTLARFLSRAAADVHSALLLVGLLAAASIAAAPAKTFELTIVRGALPAEQRALRVTKGDALRLRLSSDTPGELHLHGYRLEAKLIPGAAVEIAFIARATGRYRLEWHPAGQAPSSAHHGPPLATLEVRPQ